MMNPDHNTDPTDAPDAPEADRPITARWPLIVGHIAGGRVSDVAWRPVAEPADDVPGIEWDDTVAPLIGRAK